MSVTPSNPEPISPLRARMNGACGHTAISHNSCMNRHCPKCQGAAAREWLAARRGRALAGAVFPPGVHLARADRGHRLPEQGCDLRHAVRPKARSGKDRFRHRETGIQAHRNNWSVLVRSASLSFSSVIKAVAPPHCASASNEPCKPCKDRTTARYAERQWESFRRAARVRQPAPARKHLVFLPRRVARSSKSWAQ